MLKASPTAEKTQRYLEILHAECNRESELINDLLDLQRLETVSYPLLLSETLNLKEWLPSVIAPFRVRTQQNQQILQINLANDLPLLVTDRASVERIVAELLNNACKYTPAGGEIVLSVSHQNSGVRTQEPALRSRKKVGKSTGSGDARGEQPLVPLTFSHSPLTPHSCTILNISNQAEISAVELPRIFEKFYRIASGDRWKQGGTGLGLALVQKLVEHLQGTISVNSSEGWTTFVVQLPHGNAAIG
jgi:signal transduction histidine kinase